MKDAAEIAKLRILLRNVNMDYSALLRGTGHEGKFVRLEALKEQRLDLMSRITELRRRQAASFLCRCIRISHRYSSVRLPKPLKTRCGDDAGWTHI